MGKHSSPPQSCGACGGSGKTTIGNNGSTREVNCVVCHGSGKV